jgi:hypothetical protein
LIFIHAHDRSSHYPGGTIWDHIEALVKTDYFRTRDFGNVINSVLFLGLGFFPRDGYPWAQMDEWPINMTDYAYFLFRNTSFMNMPWTEWHMPCCSTFFMNSDLIRKHPQWEYRTVMDRVRTTIRVEYCDLFNRSTCASNPSQSERKFILGGLLERAWGAMFTGRSDQEWNMTHALGEL